MGIAVTLSAFRFQIDKKNKVPSDLEQMTALPRSFVLQLLLALKTPFGLGLLLGSAAPIKDGAGASALAEMSSHDTGKEGGES
ncbi:hypothetical protein U0070_011767 [Myodes glareolus]|uniref:Uncharacterized protein n=1 Tax=Myodes glareolus TaxID=447135 RepID=A0AAW0I2M7_MYOGA